MGRQRGTAIQVSDTRCLLSRTVASVAIVYRVRGRAHAREERRAQWGLSRQSATVVAHYQPAATGFRDVAHVGACGDPAPRPDERANRHDAQTPANVVRLPAWQGGLAGQ